MEHPFLHLMHIPVWRQRNDEARASLAAAPLYNIYEIKLPQGRQGYVWVSKTSIGQPGVANLVDKMIGALKCELSATHAGVPKLEDFAADAVHLLMGLSANKLSLTDKQCFTIAAPELLMQSKAEKATAWQVMQQFLAIG